jgi:MFS family permease
VTAAVLALVLFRATAAPLLSTAVAAAWAIAPHHGGTLSSHPTSRRTTAVGLLIAGASYGAIAIGRAGVVAVIGSPLWTVATSGHYHYSGQFGLALAAGAALAAALGAYRDRAAALLLLATTLRLVLAPPVVDTHETRARRCGVSSGRRPRQPQRAPSFATAPSGPRCP